MIAFPAGQDIMILNSDGLCVASSNPTKIGRTLNTNRISNLDRVHLNIKNSAIDLLYRRKKSDPRELAFAKKLTRIVAEQYLSKSLISIDTVDRLVMEIVDEPINSEKIALFQMRAESLGLNLDIKRSAILIAIEDFTGNNLSGGSDIGYSSEDIIKTWKRKIIMAMSSFFTLKADVISAYVGDGRFVFFKEVIGDEKKFIKNMKFAYTSIFGSVINSSKNKINVSFSNLYSGVEGLRESYHEALQALQFGERFGSKKGQSYYYGDLGAIRILTEDNLTKKRQLAREVLNPLNKKILRLTLETYFDENMDINKTARKLGVHPNTVSYRIDRIAENLNLNPRVFKQAFELRIALLTDNIFE